MKIYQILAATLLLVPFSLPILYLTLARTGCDFVQFHLKSINENGTFTGEDHVFGLGLKHHHGWSINADTREILVQQTCLDNDPISNNPSPVHTQRNSFYLTDNLLVFSCLINVLGFLGLAIMLGVAPVMKGSALKSNMTVYTILFIGSLSAISMLLQKAAIDKIDDVGGICDHDEYIPNEELLWQTNSTFQTRFIQECKIGADGRTVVHSIALCGTSFGMGIFLAMILALHNYYHKKKEEEFQSSDGATICMQDEEDSEEREYGMSGYHQGDEERPSDLGGLFPVGVAATAASSDQVNL